MTELERLKKICCDSKLVCLCGLPGCKECAADDLFEKESRTAMPKLIAALEVAMKTLNYIEGDTRCDECHNNDCAVAIDEIEAILKGASNER